MNRQLIFALSSGIAFVLACLLAHSVVLAQYETKPVGTPKCDPYNEPEGRKCINLKCDASSDPTFNYDSCTPTYNPGAALCEYVPSGGTLDQPLECELNTAPNISKCPITTQISMEPSSSKLRK